MRTPPPWMHTRGPEVRLVMERRRQMAAIKGLRSFPLGFGKLGEGRAAADGNLLPRDSGEEPRTRAVASQLWEGKHALHSEHRLEAAISSLSSVFRTNLEGEKKKDSVAACLGGGGRVRGGLSVFSQVLTPPPPLLLLGNTGNSDWQSLQIGVILTVITPTRPYLEGSAEIQCDTSKTEGGKKTLSLPAEPLIGESHGLGRGHTGKPGANGGGVFLGNPSYQFGLLRGGSFESTSTNPVHRRALSSLGRSEARVEEVKGKLRGRDSEGKF